MPQSGQSSSDSAFNQVLSNFNVTDIKRPLYFANTPELRRLYVLFSTANEDSLLAALQNINMDSSLVSQHWNHLQQAT